MTKDPVEGPYLPFLLQLITDGHPALRNIDEIGGISRILTRYVTWCVSQALTRSTMFSGHKPQALDGLQTLDTLFKTRKELIEDEAWGLTIMPGSGVNSNSIAKLLKALLPLGVREIHLSGGKWMPGGMVFKQDGMGMGAGSGAEWAVWKTQENEVRLVRAIADSMWKDFHHPSTT